MVASEAERLPTTFDGYVGRNILLIMIDLLHIKSV